MIFDYIEAKLIQEDKFQLNGKSVIEYGKFEQIIQQDQKLQHLYFLDDEVNGKNAILELTFFRDAPPLQSGRSTPMFNKYPTYEATPPEGANPAEFYKSFIQATRNNDKTFCVSGTEVQIKIRDSPDKLGGGVSPIWFVPGVLVMLATSVLGGFVRN